MRNELKKTKEKERKKERKKKRERTKPILEEGKTEGHKQILHYFSLLSV